VRLPFESDRLVEILCDTEPSAANNPLDEDHATFWIVLADQFAKRGIGNDSLRDKALAILDSDEDPAIMTKLGMKEGDLRKRRQMLQQVRARIASGPVHKVRAVLKSPQPMLLDLGDVIAYPTCIGKCINPYYPSKDLDKCYTRNGAVPWQQDGWAAAVIIECGRAFEFLAWYRPMKIGAASPERPTLNSLWGDRLWRLELPGTCSQSHFKRMELEKIGKLEIDPAKVTQYFPGMRSGISAAVSDVSIANRLSVAPHTDSNELPKRGESSPGRAPVVWNLDAVLRQAE
jgi:hypothetical protein